MKLSLILSALASTAIAAPLNLPNLPNLNNLLSTQLPTVGNAGELNNALGGKLGNLGDNGELPLEGLLKGLKDAPKAPAPAGGNHGKILQDLAPLLDNVLVVTGPNAQSLLLQLSPEVTALVSGLGLAPIGVPLGQVVASASSVGDLVTALGPQVHGLVTVLAQGVGALAIQISPGAAALVSGLGLPNVGAPLGTVLATVGNNL